MDDERCARDHRRGSYQAAPATQADKDWRTPALFVRTLASAFAGLGRRADWCRVPSCATAGMHRPSSGTPKARAGSRGLVVGLAVLTGACGSGLHPAASATSPSNSPIPPTAASPASQAVKTSAANSCSGLPPGKKYCPTPIPTSAGPFVTDLAWVTDTVGWALAAVPCAGKLCPAVAATTDGGVTWRPLPDPPAPPFTSGQPGVRCAQATCVDQIRFATATVGYLFGPGFLMTVDGGRSWQQVPGPPVEDLEVNGGSVFRVVYDHTGCPGPCEGTLEEAAAGSNTWRTLLQLPLIGGSDEALILQGSDLYLPIYGDPADGQPFVGLYRSLDGGQTWQQLANPCASTEVSAEDPVDFAAAPDGYLAALCFSITEPSTATVLTSDNSGSSWGPQLPVPGNAGLIAAPSAGRLVVGTWPTGGEGPTASTLSISADGGRVWSTAASDSTHLDAEPVGASLYLGFVDATRGQWIGDGLTIWSTTDGGASWSSRPFALA